jgi:hypothetical protein
MQMQIINLLFPNRSGFALSTKWVDENNQIFGALCQTCKILFGIKTKIKHLNLKKNLSTRHSPAETNDYALRPSVP